jgi:hypothetical protein
LRRRLYPPTDLRLGRLLSERVSRRRQLFN